jgi:hypothetical protein
MPRATSRPNRRWAMSVVVSKRHRRVQPTGEPPARQQAAWRQTVVLVDSSGGIGSGSPPPWSDGTADSHLATNWRRRPPGRPSGSGRSRVSAAGIAGGKQGDSGGMSRPISPRTTPRPRGRTEEDGAAEQGQHGYWGMASGHQPARGAQALGWATSRVAG